LSPVEALVSPLKEGEKIKIQFKSASRTQQQHTATVTTGEPQKLFALKPPPSATIANTNVSNKNDGEEEDWGDFTSS